ncbi:MAG: extracellular solute-binding protein [Cyanobacteriota bacterium]|nr:extracellular solute-binding protein [Cyanobacteriota bacterium]
MKINWQKISLIPSLGLLFLGACAPANNSSNTSGLEVKFLVGSALAKFCNQAATQLNQQQPKLDNGQSFYLKCEAKGSGDVVTDIISLSQQLKSGTTQPDSPKFPTLISVDGEIYHSQLLYQINQIYPGQNYIPQITDAPLLANSPMVFMVSQEIAAGLRGQPDIYRSLVNAKTHQDLDPNSPQLPIHYVHTAPTRSNSGLQTLVAQFASVANKRPEQLTVADIQQYQPQIQKIQSKVTRYGASTSSLAEDMVKNGPFWASIASVYESSVIEANTDNTQTRYEAIYPSSTFTSNMRAILPTAPWVSEDEQEAAEKVIEYLRSPTAQKILTDLGLRPGIPGVSLGAKFSPQYGVDPNAQYDSLRTPQPEVVNAMIKSWQEFAKKPSQVVLVVDSSGSMKGDKLPAVQNTLRYYLEGLGPKERIALIDFDSEIQAPVWVDGTTEGRARGMQFISSLKANGGTRLYDAALNARNLLQENLSSDAINAVVILTDGEDSGSKTSLQQLSDNLKNSGFNSDKRIAFFTVGYGKEGEFDAKVLKQIASLNGGYYRQGDPESIVSLMSDLQTEF